MAIPDWVVDFESYRRWAHSAAYPQTGWISFLDGEIWVDLSPEELFTHNQVRSAISMALMTAAREHAVGEFVGAKMFFTNSIAKLATEPDGMFYLWDTMRSGRLRLTEKRDHDYMEISGTPDIVVEVVSDVSEHKDKEILRALYWKAGIREYWLVDARGEPEQFDILQNSEHGFVATLATDGWLRSDVLGRDFRLMRQSDPLRHPQFVVEAR